MVVQLSRVGDAGKEHPGVRPPAPALVRKHLQLNCWSYCFSSAGAYAWQDIYSRLRVESVAPLDKISVMPLALGHEDLAPSFIVNNFRSLPRQWQWMDILILPFSAHRCGILGDRL